jgi:hypothetical protein
MENITEYKPSQEEMISTVHAYGELSTILTHLQCSLDEPRKQLAAHYRETARESIKKIPPFMRVNLPNIRELERILEETQ